MRPARRLITRRSSTHTMTCAATLVALATLAASALADPPADPTWVSPEGEIRHATTLFPAPRPLTRADVQPPNSEAAEFVGLNVDIEGDGPRELCFTPDGLMVLVVNQDTDTLTFIDANTREVVAGVTVGDYPQSVAVTPDGKYAVVANIFTNDVSIIDVATRTLLGHVPVQGLQAYGVRITPDSKFAVVGVINDAVNSQFTIVDIAALAVDHIIPSSSQGSTGGYATPDFGISGNSFTKFALSPDGADIVLPHSSASKVNIYDVATGAATSVDVAANAGAVDISADSTTAVVAHQGPTRRISIIDLPSRTLTASRTTASDLDYSGHIRITPSKTHAICSILNAAIFVDLATGNTTSTIGTGSVGDIEISFDGQFAFVSNFNSSVISIATQSLVKTITFAACSEAAVSPVSLRACALNNRFREDAQFYNINGASGSFEGRTLTGAAPESDCPKPVAVSPDGRSLVIGNVLSRNASVLDLGTGVVRATLDTGDRAMDVAITPDSSMAIVCNGDSDTVSFIDLASDAVTATLAITGRPARVVVSPSGQFAYILNVAGTDLIHKISLTGTPASVGTQLAGQTGSISSYAYGEISGIALSPDGSILGVCDSFNDRLVLINTATMAIIASPTVGDFPIRAVFNADGSRAYVTNSFSNNMSVVNINGGASATIATVSGLSTPLAMAIDNDGSHVYVGAGGTTNPGVYAVNTATNVVSKYLSLGGDKPRDMEFAPSCDILIVGATAANFVNPDRMHRVRAAGAATAIIDTTVLTGSLPDIAYSRTRHAAVAPMTIPDGIDLVRFTPTSDLNHDGQITLEDYFDFFNAFDTGGLAADMDGNGEVSLEDFFTFFNGFDLGCP